ncbi:MAG: hypothetical protein JXR91_05955 [Deltaproteobacteria bacterium]|nr:hypothetical protein [Deltaproteobacteria bacterium]
MLLTLILWLLFDNFGTRLLLLTPGDKSGVISKVTVRTDKDDGNGATTATVKTTPPVLENVL